MILSGAIQKILAKRIKSNFLAKVIGEKEMNLIFEELRNEFISADVNFEVATEFFRNLKEEIKSERKIFMGKEEVQLEIYEKIKAKLIESLGSKSSDLNFNRKRCSKFLLVGVNGSGKTTTAGKLAYTLREKFGLKNVETVSLDGNRAAAFQQLQQLVTPINVKSYFLPEIDNLQQFEEKLKTKDVEAVIYDSGGIIPKDDQGLVHLKNL
ncbi:hypothetical protein PVNG_02371 [Plasmodium vivax North Korean]|uniref:Uncharacterized protein n=1 Tax=Plasmodium vivax North Korean TaxID=1035514 RepID=A0A0J9W6M9_PLAVI|nr:hypothetical protein PVNG_02371 [Plasmodium vivax North Korean]